MTKDAQSTTLAEFIRDKSSLPRWDEPTTLDLVPRDDEMEMSIPITGELHVRSLRIPAGKRIVFTSNVRSWLMLKVSGDSAIEGDLVIGPVISIPGEVLMIAPDGQPLKAVHELLNLGGRGGRGVGIDVHDRPPGWRATGGASGLPSSEAGGGGGGGCGYTSILTDARTVRNGNDASGRTPGTGGGVPPYAGGAGGEPGRRATNACGGMLYLRTEGTLDLRHGRILVNGGSGIAGRSGLRGGTGGGGGGGGPGGPGGTCYLRFGHTEGIPNRVFVDGGPGGPPGSYGTSNQAGGLVLPGGDDLAQRGEAGPVGAFQIVP